MIRSLLLLISLTGLVACGGSSASRSVEAPGAGPEERAPFARWEGMWAELSLVAASEVRSEFLTRGQSLTQPWRLAPHQCQLAISRGEGSLSDVDAFVFEGDGRLIVQDTSERAGGYSAVIICASESARELYIHWRAVRGGGVAHTLFLEVPRAALRGVSERLQAVRARAESARWSRMDTWLQGMRRRGFSMRGEVTAVPIRPEQPVRLGLRLRGPECVTVAGFGGRGIEYLSLRVVDALGRTVVESGPTGRDAFVQACSDHPVDWSVVVGATGDGGVVQYLRLDGDPMMVPNASSLWYGERRVYAGAAHDAEGQTQRLLGAMGFTRPVSVSSQRLEHGEVWGHEVVVRGGPCVAVLATSSEGIPLELGVIRRGDSLGLPPRHPARDVGIQLWCDTRDSRRIRIELSSAYGAADALITVATGPNPLGADGAMSEPALLAAYAEELAAGWRLIPALRRRVAGRGQERLNWPPGEPCVRARWVGERETRAILQTHIGIEDDAHDRGLHARITRCDTPQPEELSLQLQGREDASGWLLWFEPSVSTSIHRR